MKSRSTLGLVFVALLSLFFFPERALSNQKSTDPTNSTQRSVNPTHSQATTQQTQPPLFPKEIVLDGKKYTDSELAKAFAQIAFSSYIRPNNFVYALPLGPPNERCAFPSTKWSQSCGTPSEYKETYPWLYEYLYRDRGVPRYFAINKFTAPIRISVGYPNDLFPSSPDGQRLACKQLQAKTNGTSVCIQDNNDLSEQTQSQYFPHADEYRQALKVVEDEVSAAIPLLREATGLPVSYLPHDKETKENYANVRIVLQDIGYNQKSAVIPSGMTTEFRGNPLLRAPHGYTISKSEWIYFREGIEPVLTTAVRFTPYSGLTPDELVPGKEQARQVDGYLLPKADNSIGMSFCFIYVHANEKIPAFVRECLIRSLGLPNAPHLSPSMILGLWNGEIPEQMRRIILGLNNPPSDIEERLKSQGEWGPLSPPITEFDRFIVKTIYSPAITPGMSVPEFYEKIIPTIKIKSGEKQ